MLDGALHPVAKPNRLHSLGRLGVRVASLSQIAFLLSCVLAPWPAAGQVPPRISTADFAAKPTARNPILSPDGRSIATRIRVGSASMLAISDADDPSKRQVRLPLGDVILSDVNWAGSQRLLLTVVAKIEVFGNMVPITRLIAFDVPTKKILVIDQKSRGIVGGDVLYADPSGAWALVASQNDIFSYPSVKRVDLVTGEAKVVEKARTDVWDWYADSHGVVRGGIAYNSRRWTFWYRDQAGSPLRAIKGKFDKDDDSAVDRVTFGSEDGTGSIVTNEKTGRFAAYKYDFKSGTIGAPIYENSDVDISEVLLNPDTGDIRAVRYEDDRWRTQWLEPQFSSLQQRLDRALPGAVNEVVSLSADGNRALVLSSGANDPGAYFLLDRKAATMHPVIEPFDRIDERTLAKVTAVKYQARDGLQIPAYLTLPRARAEKGLPLVVLPHGGPFIRDDWQYDAIVQFLANRGYAVLQPQFRGSTGYGRKFVESGYGQWGRKMQDDLDDGADWLIRSGKVDPKRVCIMGASYGGYAALWGAIRNPDRYRCAVSYAGVSDLAAQLRDNRRSFSATRYFREWRAKIAGEGKFDLSAVSPISFAAQMKVPVLIAHGEEDDTVSVKQSHAMVAALTKAKADVTSIFYPKSGHDWGDSVDFEDFLKRLDAFLAKNNPA